MDDYRRHSDRLRVLNKELLYHLDQAPHLVNIAKLSSLLESKADSNVKNDEGETPLILAAKHGNYPAAKILLTERERETSMGFCAQEFQ
eukprot:CAMPEP_0184491694 /NCGR_PEP_ID=MMETSP0113_2-20130426/21154_1 /TAXON_ID=91329 /ORGANISM="Norrisiella sphaerica, Strain BC52" /LENGTH=88 /DNA_ID=CAMNT_0026876161 /DNA_START=51 /DNA_END=314 /DNA_ORIENTATION=-